MHWPWSRRLRGSWGTSAVAGRRYPDGMPLDPAPTHVLVHVSDTHLLADGAQLHAIDTLGNTRRAFERLVWSGIRPDAIVHTGDIADRGESDAYRRMRELIAPFLDTLNTQAVWVVGNHDMRAALREHLLQQPRSTEPIDTVHTVDGLRIITLDTSVPGEVHGELGPEQLDWLAHELATGAAHGTVLALHHPPIDTQAVLLQPFQLQKPQELARVLEGSDVRAILAGHLHYPSAGTLAGIPVYVAPATSYTVQLTAPGQQFIGVDGGQGMALVFVYPDRIVHSAFPLGDFRVAVALDEDHFAPPQ